MSAAPCGCQALHKLKADPERVNAEKSLAVATAAGDAGGAANARSTLQGFRLLEQGAVEDSHAWRCPLVGYERDTDTASLPDPHRSALLEINSVCKTQATGCPHAAIAAPWVDRAVRAYEWQKHLRGALGDIETPTVALVDAVVEISRSVNAREQHEHNEMKKKAQQ